MHTKFVWLLGIVPNLILTAMLLAGMLAVGSGAITLGGLFAFVSYVLILVFPLEALGWILAMAQEAMTAADRVYEVLDTAPVIDDRPGDDVDELGATVVEGHIRFEGVRFRYPGLRSTEVLGRCRSRDRAGRDAGARSARPARARPPWPRCWPACTTRPPAGSPSTATTSATSPVTSLRRHVGFAFEEATLFSASVRENLRIGKPDCHRRRHRPRRCASPRPTSSTTSRGGSTPASASRA